MEDTGNTRKVVGKFVGRYILLSIIIGGISFLLENLIPQLVKWKFNSTLIIYQTVLFVISTLLTVTLAMRGSIKNVKITSEEEAKKITKPSKVLIMVIALLVMIINLGYCYGIQKSGYVDADNKYKSIEGIYDSHKEELKRVEKEKVHSTSTIYLAGKEIVTIFTYAYAIVYVESMVLNSVKESKKEVEK